MKALGTIISLLSWVIIIVFGVLFASTFLGNFPIQGTRSLVVLSGSMEPTIRIGDIIIVRPKESYGKNDTVTFRSTDGRIVTHRIVEEKKDGNKTVFTTKGDANRSEDQDTITQGDILGTVVLVVPKIGYAAEFSRTWMGFALFVGIPVVLLIAGEVVGMFTHERRR